MTTPFKTKYFVTTGTQLYIMDSTASPVTAKVAAQLQGLQGIGGQKSSIKLSNFDSPGYDEYAGGLVDPGKPTGNVVMDVNSAAHQLLHHLVGLGQGSDTSFFYGLADGTGDATIDTGALTPPTTGTSPKTYARSGYLFNGFVNEFSVTAQVNNVVMAKFGAQASGAIGLVVKGGSAVTGPIY